METIKLTLNIHDFPILKNWSDVKLTQTLTKMVEAWGEDVNEETIGQAAAILENDLEHMFPAMASY